MSAIVDRLFILLNEYANASGTTKLNVNELNQHLFKAVVTVLRQVIFSFNKLTFHIVLGARGIVDQTPSANPFEPRRSRSP